MKKQELPVNTPVLVGDMGNSVYDLEIRFYAGNGECFVSVNDMECLNNVDRKIPTCPWGIIIPFDKFDPNDFEGSLKHNIIK